MVSQLKPHVTVIKATTPVLLSAPDFALAHLRGTLLTCGRELCTPARGCSQVVTRTLWVPTSMNTAMYLLFAEL